MPKIIIFIAYCYSLQIAYAQKHDYNWIVGSKSSTSLINFNQSPPEISIWDDDILFIPVFVPPTTFSDSSGALLYYIDLRTIRNKNDLFIDGSDSLIRKSVIGGAGCLALPYPGRPNHSCLIRTMTDQVSVNNNVANDIYMSVIDHTKNSGLGSIVLANKFLMSGKIHPIRACKHANGRDWWIIATDLNYTIFYTFLLDPSGISGPFTQEVVPGLYFPNGTTDFSPALSPDGTIFIRYQNLELARYEFDRCSGQFSYISSMNIAITAPDIWPIYLFTAVFSPDSRFLYLASGKNLYSCDLELWPNTLEPVVLAGNVSPDQPSPSIDLTIARLGLAPNGKIYAVSGGDNVFFHEINRPNQPSFACDFRYKALDLLTSETYYPPIYPNYRLGKLIGSTCDTLAIHSPISDH